ALGEKSTLGGGKFTECLAGTRRSAGGGDLPGATRVPGDVDERAVGGGAALGRGAGGALGLGWKALALAATRGAVRGAGVDASRVPRGGGADCSGRLR